jgi:AraC-like DNA-binding protein
LDCYSGGPLSSPDDSCYGESVETEGHRELLAPLGPPCASLATTVYRVEAVNRAARYLADHLAEPLTLEEVARAAGMSKFHLHRVFDEHVGCTLGRYLGGVRLKAALELLSAPEARRMSVLDVALQVGFGDASAFSRSFQRCYGITPSALRRGDRVREFPLVPAAARGAVLAHGVTVVTLPEFWIFGYEVAGQKYKDFSEQAPEGFKLAWDTIQRHGIEGVESELALPTYSWILPEVAWRLLCGFRSSVRLDVGSMSGRVVRAGKWIRARHTGPHATRWQTWQRLQLQQLRLGRPRDGREPFEEEVARAHRPLGLPACDVYFPV